MNHRKTELIERKTRPTSSSGDGWGLESASLFNPMMPWSKAMPWLQLEYHLIEIRLGDGEARIHGERASLRDGVITGESIDATLPAELYFESAERVQQQMQTMMQAFMLPWAAMMLPFIPRG